MNPPIDVVTGAFSYSGRFVAAELLERGRGVRTLTNHPKPDDPLAARIPAQALDFEDDAALVAREEFFGHLRRVVDARRYVTEPAMAVQKRVAPVTDLLVRPGGPIVIGVQRKLFGAFHAHTLKPSYGGPAQVDRPIAGFLRSYQLDGGYTPGPLLALCALAGLAGSVSLLVRRRAGRAAREPALACLLFFASGVSVLLVSDVFEFSWRYLLPALVTLVPAGALGIGIVIRAAQARHAAG